MNPEEVMATKRVLANALWDLITRGPANFECVEEIVSEYTDPSDTTFDWFRKLDETMNGVVESDDAAAVKLCEELDDLGRAFLGNVKEFLKNSFGYDADEGRT